MRCAWSLKSTIPQCLYTFLLVPVVQCIRTFFNISLITFFHQRSLDDLNFTLISFCTSILFNSGSWIGGALEPSGTVRGGGRGIRQAQQGVIEGNSASLNVFDQLESTDIKV